MSQFVFMVFDFLFFTFIQKAMHSIAHKEMYCY